MADEATQLADRLVGLLEWMEQRGCTQSQIKRAVAEECAPYSRGVQVQAMNVMKRR